jgi:pyruvate ferredoxin oxidoreductase beta subunit
MATNLKALPDEELVGAGRSGCAGCAAMLVARMVLKALGPQTIMVSATGCLISNYTHAGSPQVPFMHSLLPAAASLVSGIDSGLKALGKRQGVNVMAIAGDGGTADIGLQALSGAAERGHRFLYVCYDNEGYMNTGGQRSGTTPFDANTSTTPAGKGDAGLDLTRKKNMALIMAAHGIPYVATASVAYPQDFLRKVKKAAAIDGPSYIHVVTPCNYRWGFAEDQSVKVSKVAVQTRVAPLFEVEDGQKYSLSFKDRPRRLVAEYLKLQSRFRHLTDEQIDRIQTRVDERWAYLRRLSQADD